MYALALVACALAGCSDDEGHEQASEPPAAQSAPLKAEPQAPAEPSAAPAAPKPAPEPPKYPREGWSKVTVDDQVPICVFADYNEHAKFDLLSEVTKQKLSANSSVVFGAFSPWCVNEACDDLPSMQCKTEREGNTLVVHTHYWGYRKDGINCTESCRPVTAGCKTPELEAGTYTVQHGEKSYKLKIPSVLRNPCFDSK